MNLYVMRHGTSSWNEKGIIQGWAKNNALSEQGISLVQIVAYQLKDVDLDIIISSPLLRAMQTAKIVNQFHKVKIKKDKRLLDLNQGIFTGRYKNSLTQEEVYLRSRRDKSTKMETYEKHFERAKSFFEAIKENKKYKTILIVTHEVLATFIQYIIENKEIDFSDHASLHNFKNAEIKKFII